MGSWIPDGVRASNAWSSCNKSGAWSSCNKSGAWLLCNDHGSTSNNEGVATRSNESTATKSTTTIVQQLEAHQREHNNKTHNNEKHNNEKQWGRARCLRKRESQRHSGLARTRHDWLRCVGVTVMAQVEATSIKIKDHGFGSPQKLPTWSAKPGYQWTVLALTPYVWHALPGGLK